MNKKNKSGLLKISIRTHQNGYSLDVEGGKLGSEGFFYHDLESLLTGFYVRVGLHELGVMDQEAIDQMMLTALTYEQNKEEIRKQWAEERRHTSKEHRKEALLKYFAKKKEADRQKGQDRWKPKRNPKDNVTERTLSALDIKIKQTGLSPRMVAMACRCIAELTGQPIDTQATLGELIRWDKDDLLSVRSVGIAAVGKINSMLLKYDMHLGMDANELRRLKNKGESET